MILRDECRMTKIRLITKLYKTLLCLSVYVSYEYSKHFVQPIVQPAVECIQTCSFDDLCGTICLLI